MVWPLSGCAVKVCSRGTDVLSSSRDNAASSLFKTNLTCTGDPSQRYEFYVDGDELKSAVFPTCASVWATLGGTERPKV